MVTMSDSGNHSVLVGRQFDPTHLLLTSLLDAAVISHVPKKEAAEISHFIRPWSSVFSDAATELIVFQLNSS